MKKLAPLLIALCLWPGLALAWFKHGAADNGCYNCVQGIPVPQSYFGMSYTDISAPAPASSPIIIGAESKGGSESWTNVELNRTPISGAVSNGAGGTRITAWAGPTAKVAARSSNGSGYVTGDTITLTGGTCATQPVLTITATAGAVSGTPSITNPGQCTVVPANPVAQGSTSGSGTGATFAITWTPCLSASVCTAPSGTSIPSIRDAYISQVVGTTELNGHATTYTVFDSSHVDIPIAFVNAYVSGGNLNIFDPTIINSFNTQAAMLGVTRFYNYGTCPLTPWTGCLLNRNIPADNQVTLDWINWLTQTYGNTFLFYEAWNEPDTSILITAADEATWLNLTAPVIRAAGLKVAMNANHGTCTPTTKACVTNVLNAWQAIPGTITLDYATLHGYGNPTTNSPEDATVGVYNDVSPSWAAFGLSTLPLYDTEGGWSCNGSGGCSTYVTRWNDRAAFAARELMIEWSLGIPRKYWYEWNGGATEGTDSQWGPLVLDTGFNVVASTPNQAGIAYQQVQNWLLGASLATGGCVSSPATVNPNTDTSVKGNITSGSPTVVSITPNTTGMAAGMEIKTISTGVGIPGALPPNIIKTYIASVDSSSQITVNQNLTSTVTGRILTATGNVWQCPWTRINGYRALSVWDTTAPSTNITNATNSGGNVRLTVGSTSGMSTGTVVVSGVGGTTEANGTHTGTVVDATTIDLNVAFVNAYTSLGTVNATRTFTIPSDGNTYIKYRDTFGATTTLAGGTTTVPISGLPILLENQ